MTLAEFLTQASASPPAPSATVGARDTLLRRTLPVAVILHAGGVLPVTRAECGSLRALFGRAHVVVSVSATGAEGLCCRNVALGGLEERRPLGWTFLCPDSVAD